MNDTENFNESDCNKCKFCNVESWKKPCNDCSGDKWEPKVTDTNFYDSHYDTDCQPIDFMQANMTHEEFMGFLKGNIIKYAGRCGRKDDVSKETAKILRYAEWLHEAALGNKINPRI